MKRLKQYLDEQGLSQSQFAAMVGVKQPTVWEWLNGASLPSAPRLVEISRVTGLSINELLTGIRAA